MPLEQTITNEQELSDALSEPYAEDVELAGRLDDDVIVLGAGGKMGPTLVGRIARAIAAAGAPHKVYAVSRFSSADSRREIEQVGGIPIPTDLLDDEALAALPPCRNVLFLVGMKFGSTGKQALTWAINAYLPGRVARHFRDARIVALSTGNVYPKVPVSSGGSKESDPVGPLGEYAQSCLGRERVFEYFSEQQGTPVCLIRLNYAVEARYGVLLDIASKVYAGKPVSVEMGYVNVIWQGDANSACFRALELCESPASILNLTGVGIHSVRELAETFGARFGRAPQLVGEEQSTALLNDASRYHTRFGAPRVSTDDVIELVANWVQSGGSTLGKPTKFEVRDGQF